MIESVVGILLGIGLSLNAWAGLRLNKAIGELNNRVTELEVWQIHHGWKISGDPEWDTEFVIPGGKEDTSNGT